MKRTAKYYHSNGRKHIKKKHWKWALRCFEKATTLEPDNSVEWCYKGYVLKKLDRRPEAIDCFKRSLELDSEYILPMKHLADCFASMRTMIRLWSILI